MRMRSELAAALLPVLRRHPRLKEAFKRLDFGLELLRHLSAPLIPQVIRPDPREIFVTLTSDCNLRCLGCRYGRDFMPGARLPWPIIRQLLDDAYQLGIRSIRFYGGEPLLHKDIVRAVEYSLGLGLNTWITTNGILLDKKIDDLFRAGLRSVDVGFYGVDGEYDAYVQKADQYPRMKAGITYLRDRYGMDVAVNLGWVLMRSNCNLNSVQRAWEFAERYSTPIGISLIHYSLPYFSEGPDRMLQFRPEDRPAIETVVAELIRLKVARPELIQQSVAAIRSIPDWLIKGPNMRVPCDRYRLIWIGADGTVQLCYVTFKLGNLHERRLAELLFRPTHHRAAQDAFALRCPNCHCNYDTRIRLHLPSRWKYSGPAGGPI